jgi:hypothetical protein
MVENSEESMKTKHAVKSPENFKERKQLKSRNNDSSERLKNLSQPKIVNNTDINSTVTNGKYALWVGPNEREERPTVPFDLP